ncbi:MAG: UbiD family decarboxylase [Acidobacteria bacterium]|nr:UbiD family decarboxylase [Acidobacteriota bacterium]
MTVHDLRSALRALEETPGQLLRTQTPVDPKAELAGVYRHVGAGGTVQRPTKTGPAMLFENVKGYPGVRILAGMLATRERTALLVGSRPERIGRDLLRALDSPVEPEPLAAGEPAPCQEVVHRPPLDVLRLVPAPTNTPEDAGPYFTLGVLRATDPETGCHDVTIHRLCVQGPDRLSVFFAPGRHIDVFRRKAEAVGKPLPVSISIGLDPAIYLSISFEPPTTPLGFDELAVAGGLRGRPVELVRCVTQPEFAIARAEFVIEGEILPGERIREDVLTSTGHAMPEFPGYNGPANPSLPVIRVTGVTHRRNPIMQTIVGPGEEHVSLAGIPTEASILRMTEAAMPGRVLNCYAHSAGGGKFLAILQFRKTGPLDDGRARQAALIALAAFHELKNVVVVDDDVDLFDTNDVLWAMTSRYQGARSTIFIPGVIGHPLDPSQDPDYSPDIPVHGISTKTIFDCTAPFAMKDRFARAQFLDVDPGPFLIPSTRPFTD